MIDTSEIGAGSYPCPEEKFQEVQGKVLVIYSFEDYFPDNWDVEKIKDYIKNNVQEYMQNLEKVEDIEIWEEK